MAGNPAYNRLMHDVCVGYGYCGGIVDGVFSHVDDFIPESGPVSADQFVDWLFAAEGKDDLVPEPMLSKHRSDLKDYFIKHMKSNEVDASELKWDL